MMKTLKWWALGVAIALVVVAGSEAMVRANNDDDDDDDDPALAAQLVQSGDILPPEQLLDRALAEHPGKKLKDELEHERGRYIYAVKILDAQGIVWKMKFDAKTGTLLRTKQDD